MFWSDPLDPFKSVSSVSRAFLGFPMPELPEVETVARDLRPLLVGRTLLSVRRSKQALRQAWDKGWEPLLANRRVEAVERRGKWLLVGLDRGAYLMVHLGMTGQFT